MVYNKKGLVHVVGIMKSRISLAIIMAALHPGCMISDTVYM